MLWLMGTRVLWRTLEELPPSLPPPPPSPPLPPYTAPPDPPPPPLSHACHEYADESFGNAYPTAFKEPCGLTFDACCRLAYEHAHTAAFHLSPSGCCTLLDVPSADQAGLAAQATQPLVDGQKERPVVAKAGARKTVP